MVFVATKVQISRRREESESGLDPNLARATHTSRCRLILAGVIRAAWRLPAGGKVKVMRWVLRRTVPPTGEVSRLTSSRNASRRGSFPAPGTGSVAGWHGCSPKFGAELCCRSRTTKRSRGWPGDPCGLAASPRGEALNLPIVLSSRRREELNLPDVSRLTSLSFSHHQEVAGVAG
jgi:hypothetical protein